MTTTCDQRQSKLPTGGMVDVKHTWAPVFSWITRFCTAHLAVPMHQSRHPPAVTTTEMFKKAPTCSYSGEVARCVHSRRVTVSGHPVPESAETSRNDTPTVRNYVPEEIENVEPREKNSRKKHEKNAAERSLSMDRERKTTQANTARDGPTAHRPATRADNGNQPQWLQPRPSRSRRVATWSVVSTRPRNEAEFTG